MAVKYYPNYGKHLNIGASCMAQFQSIGWAPFTPINVYRTVEGKARELITSGMSTVMGTFGPVVEVNPLSGLYAKTSDGLFAGDFVTITLENAMMPVEQVNWECFCNPGYSQDNHLFTAPSNIPAQHITSSNTTVPLANDIRKDAEVNAEWTGIVTAVVEPNEYPPPPYNIEDRLKKGLFDATGVGLGGGTGACAAADGGVQGNIPGPVNAYASGDQTINTPLMGVYSRGLPLIFNTTHVAMEYFKGPWGYNRSMGMYRKLLEQNPVSYYEHISILRQDGSRVSYRESGGSYESAAGSYDSLESNASGWFEKTKEGIYYEYNAHGNLKRVLDPNRNEHYYLYDDNTSSQVLEEIKCEKGLRPYFYYDDPYDDSLNTKIALRDPDDSSNNKYVYFKYDADGYMTKAVGPEGCQWYYEYNTSGINSRKLSKVIDPDNYTTYYVYDGAG